MELAGTTALVTGAGSGLGAATVRALAAGGASVIGVDLAGEDVEERVKGLGDGVAFAPADVRDERAVAAAVARAEELAGDLRIVVNCAGVATPGSVVGRRGPHDLALFQRVVDINVVGSFNVLRLAAAAMLDIEPVHGSRGVIVNTASIAAWDGQAGQAAYAASKGAVASMTLPIARDLARHRIRCVAIAPGVFATPMVEGLDDDVIVALEDEVTHPSRLGRPDEFAALVCHVVTNDYLNGEVIRLDGALRMR